MNNHTDPTGVAALIIGAVTPTITLLAVVLGMTTDVSNLLIAAVTGVVNGAVGIWAVLRARKRAYAPATVREISKQSYELGARNAQSHPQA